MIWFQAWKRKNLPWEMPIELSDHHMIDRYGSLTDKEIVNQIQTLFRKTANPDPQDIQKILAERISANDVRGLYCREPRRIKLFYRMFDTSKGPDYYIAQIRNTLAHELLHAKHHMDAYHTFDENTTEAVRVKESLADFFAFYYSLVRDVCIWEPAIADESIEVAENRFHSWERKIGGSWPYAYALMFLPVSDVGRMSYTDNYNEYKQCFDKYMTVWGFSRNSMEEAHSVLMCYMTKP